MFDDIRRPRLVRYDDVSFVVSQLRKLGLDKLEIYRRVTEVGPVDLDMLAEVLRPQNHASNAVNGGIAA